jgi:CubicO group peptidase (beta-lactamase class C family)
MNRQLSLCGLLGWSLVATAMIWAHVAVAESTGHEVLADNGADFDPGITIPNGGWNAPLGDLATYVGFLTNATNGDTATQERFDTVLRHQTLTEMWRPLYEVKEGASPDASESVGLSFFVVRRAEATLIGHTGHQAGFAAFLYLNPATGAGIVAAFNTNSDLPEGNEPSAFSRIRDDAMELIR